MEIYIEYAFLENFLYDYALLWLAFLAAQVKTRAWRLCLSAGLGGGFALLFPLLRLPSYLRAVLKLAVGAWMCMLAFGKLRGRKEWGKYGLVTILFFAFSFGFGGTLLAVYSPFSLGGKVPSLAVFLGFFASKQVFWGSFADRCPLLDFQSFHEPTKTLVVYES